jgi:hypothetical protein
MGSAESTDDIFLSFRPHRRSEIAMGFNDGSCESFQYLDAGDLRKTGSLNAGIIWWVVSGHPASVNLSIRCHRFTIA